jgi:hypothetical protein
MTGRTASDTAAATEDALAAPVEANDAPRQGKRRLRRALVMPLVALMLTMGAGGTMVASESTEAEATTAAWTRVNYCFRYWDGYRWHDISGGREVLQMWGPNSATGGWQWYDVGSSPYHCSSITAPFGDVYYRVVSLSHYGRVRGVSKAVYIGRYGGTINTGLTGVNGWIL